MKKLIFAMLLAALPYQSFALQNSAGYKLEIELRERGQLSQCEGFLGWRVEPAANGHATECVFRYANVIMPNQAGRIDYTGVLGWAKSNGEVSLDYYVGDIDAGVKFYFQIPQHNGEFVFGETPYVFQIGGGDYVNDTWFVDGFVKISEI